ncbi:cobalt-precorrin 5A hydrolase [Desulfolithobacter sp.]
MMRIAVLSITGGGRELGERLARSLAGTDCFFCRGSLRETLTRVWKECVENRRYDALVCIMATGIVVRTVGPLLRDKQTDPAVVVCDEAGRFAVSLISGHLGGANTLAEQVADILGGQAVITTASDVLGKTPLDLWIREQGFVVSDRKGLTRIMGRLVNGETVRIWSEILLPDLPPDMQKTDDPGQADLLVTCRTDVATRGVLLHPKILVAGIGCNRNTPAREIEQALAEACTENNLALPSIARLASIDLKRDETGLLEFAGASGCPLVFFNRDQLNSVDNVSSSEAVLKATGAKGVAEPAAILAAENGRLLVRKMKWANVTVAIAVSAGFS